MLSRELQVTLNLAIQEARKRRHEYLTLEHVLFAMLHDPIAQEIIGACGGDRDELKEQLLTFLDESMESLPGSEDVVPEQTLTFQRAVQRAAYHVQSSGKKEMDAGNLLVAMYRESDSHAVWLLQSQGIERLDLLNFISHGIKKSGGSAPMRRTEGAPGAEGEAASDKSPLEQWCTELVARAGEGHIDPLIGRHTEITRIIHILARRRKNNPLLIGEPGVGKTAIVEGLALRIHRGEVPDLLKGAKIYAMEMGGLLAGTRFRGDFEERLKGVIDEIKAQDKAILFVDEIHTIVGAGQTTGGHMDAGNMLKPALSNGELRMIGSTTHKDYRSSIEHDRALNRRFQTLTIDEPSQEEAVQILHGLKEHYQAHHGVTFTDDGIDAAVKLAYRHLRDRHLPDSAVDVMDEAGAEIQLKEGATVVGVDDVEATIARMARIPPRSVSAADKQQLSDLEGRLKALIYGQDSAVEQVATAVKLSRAGLGHPDKPVGSFLFAGPTGVGKTELAKQLAFSLGIEWIRFDMSEYMEKHTVSRLIGAPPGYVGFDQGGLLTDSIVKNLLDEIEKAHPDLFNVLLQVMDHATLTDNQGRKADFRNVVLIMTTNAGAQEIAKGNIGFTQGAAQDKGSEALSRMFSPEFRNRLDKVVWFDRLPQPAILRVVDKFVMELESQLAERDVTFDLTETARQWLGERGYDERFGARPMARTLHEHVKKPLADEILFGALQDGGRVRVDVSEDGESLVFEVVKPDPKAIEGKDRPALTGPTGGEPETVE